MTSLKIAIKSINKVDNVNYNTFVFMDLETTGLPAYEHNKTKITELCLLAVQTQHLSLGVFPRVQNKFSLCFNPRKLITDDSEEITGLSNNLLEHLPCFSSKTVDSLNLFLEHQPKPICLVAHNGKNFDFPVLRAEINKAGNNLMNDIYCVDSIEVFQNIYLTECEESDNNFEDNSNSDGSTVERALKIQKLNETTPKKGQNNPSSPKIIRKGNVRKSLNFGPSFKLADCYKRLTKLEPTDLHRAEADTTMLLTCAVSLTTKFINASKAVGQKFSDVPPMTPGIKIGSKLK